MIFKSFPLENLLNESLVSLMNCRELFYGYYIDDTLAGFISFKLSDKIIDIHRIAVHPHFFRRGVAGTLINFIETIDRSIRKIEVCTGRDNGPAVNLYMNLGFDKVEDFLVDSNLSLSRFEKKYSVKKQAQ